MEFNTNKIDLKRKMFNVICPNCSHVIQTDLDKFRCTRCKKESITNDCKPDFNRVGPFHIMDAYFFVALPRPEGGVIDLNLASDHDAERRVFKSFWVECVFVWHDMKHGKGKFWRGLETYNEYMRFRHTRYRQAKYDKTLTHTGQTFFQYLQTDHYKDMELYHKWHPKPSMPLDTPPIGILDAILAS